MNYARATAGSSSVIGALDPEKIEQLNVNIANVASLNEKAEKAIEDVADPTTKNILTDLCSAIKLLKENQAIIIEKQGNKAAAATANTSDNSAGMVSLGNISKRNRPSFSDYGSRSGTDAATTRNTQSRSIPVPTINTDTDTERERVSLEVAKFREAVYKAESSTLIFNLNMGRILIMNPTTMSNKATLALAAMAAENENKPGSVPEEDTVATIDDVLSMATKIDFYGRKTKTYKNLRDQKSGSFCTIPVLYEFPDKDTRFEAETYLRNKCGAHCSTPYPSILRECIKQVVDVVKTAYPDDQVKVTVDANNFCLRAARREPVEGDKKKNRWIYFDKKIPLPAMALDVDLKKVPEGFKFDLSTIDADTGGEGDSEVMEAVASESAP
jgi:hypothetical protein